MQKASVVIGRFQPEHIGHEALFRMAASTCDVLVIVLGSDNIPANITNPFSSHERAMIIQKNIEMCPDIRDNLTVRYVSVSDHASDIKWVMELKSKVKTALHGDYDITLFGHKKDDTHEYLDMFRPEWKFQPIDSYHGDLNSSMIRNHLFKHKTILDKSLPQGTIEFLTSWVTTSAFRNLRAEWNLVDKIKKGWSVAPYPVSFNTADAVVIHNGRVLMIERGAHPGKGLFALPGGYLEVRKDKSLLDCAIRELQEETGLVVTSDACLNPHNNGIIFDSLTRSVRGRIITTAFIWELNSLSTAPIIQAGSDADEVFWMPLDDLSTLSHTVFEDHAQIIDTMLKYL